MSLYEFLQFHNITEDCFYKSDASRKWAYRFYCYKNIPKLRLQPLPDVPLDSKYETCLVEFRMFPHLEFIIRNAILKLGPEWSHTIVCGTKNSDFIAQMCKDIHPNIKVIQLPYENLEPRCGYSDLLTSLDFWNLLTGEKILIHQDDTCIFHSNISEFMKYDYIGAPWCHHLYELLKRSNVTIPVGNGGFSLRTKQTMIDIIQHGYKRIYNEPEDIYFSRYIQQFNIGNLASPDIAFEFSTEQLINKNSFGGHDFFSFEPDWEARCNKHCVDCYSDN